MNIETRKKAFIQKFLKVQSEDVISRLEKVLKKEISFAEEKDSEPMTKEELNRRIDQSESEFKNNRFKTSSELLSKYK